MLPTKAGLLLFPALCLLLLTTFAAPAYPVTAASAWPDKWLADTAFYTTWSRADEPVAAGAAVRSWLWGPAPFAVANEPYAESTTGLRLVEYTDKARMEINDPGLDRNSPWFVTGGLLVTEMVTGRVQEGNNSFDSVPPAAIPVAGDAGGQTAPTYAAMARLLQPASRQAGALPSQLLARDAATMPLPPDHVQLDPRLFGYTYYDDVSQHNVPAVFREWTAQTGTVLESGRRVQGRLMDPTYLLGRPITEPYWVEAPINGKPTTVLAQLFERRALTYNPANPPEWRVEMANVGRAYYNWRYGTAPPAPSLSAEPQRGGVVIRGWNWPPGAAVQLKIGLPGGPTPLSGPTNSTARPDGTFAASLPATPELQGALLSGANVQTSATSAGAAVAMPLRGSVSSSTSFEGVLSEVATGKSTPQLTLRARDSSEWLLVLGNNTKILYSEGDPARLTDVHSGTDVAITGVATGNKLAVTELKMLSVSRTGARVGYSVQPDGKSLRVSGTGWPAEKPVNLTLAALNAGGPPPLKSVTADSRGNFSTVVALPASLPSGSLWLFAVSANNDHLLTQSAVPYDAGPEAPPQLYALTSAGEQQGALGSFCWRGQCADSASQPLPADTLRLALGEIIGFRSQYGPNPAFGLTPNTLSIEFFTRDQPAGQLSTQDGLLYFTPKAQPVFLTGDVPGIPFSVSTPRNLAPGKYVMLVQLGWPDPTGGTAKSTCAFALEIAQP